MNPTTVYLVGSGPGDPGLLTLAGAEALKRARVVLYDYLASPELLKLAPPTAELIYVGKSANQHAKTQDQINALLVEKARQFSQISNLKSEISPIIVRLKGGDPFVFGRGAEEAECLRNHNIPFVIIPGITSGLAAPAYAGIPVTHRDLASTITLITGHQRDDENPYPNPIDFPALAQLGKNGTLIFFMAVKSLPEITAKLIAAGLDPATPAALIRWGTRQDQRTLTATLATLPEEAHRQNIAPPAIAIIGKVVSLRSTLNWFESRPLFGKKILVTRTRQQASDLAAQLAQLGAQILEAPTIQIAPPLESDLPAIDQTLSHIPVYDWLIFTSPNGVRAAWERLTELGFDARHFGASNIAAIGPATSRELASIGIIPDVLPEKFVGEELAAALKSHIEEIAGKRFLLLRADIARPNLRDELLKLGATVDDLPIYRTLRPDRLPDPVLNAIETANLDWITFTSASTAENLWSLLSPAQRQKIAAAKRASIGPITSQALANLGHGQWAPTIEAHSHDIPGLVQSILQTESNHEPNK